MIIKPNLLPIGDFFGGGSEFVWEGSSLTDPQSIRQKPWQHLFYVIVCFSLENKCETKHSEGMQMYCIKLNIQADPMEYRAPAIVTV